MKTPEEQIKITARLYEIRNTAKFLYGAKYNEKMEVGYSLIQAYMKQNKIESDLVAAIDMSTSLPEYTILFMSAVVEHCEPSIKKKP